MDPIRHVGMRVLFILYNKMDIFVMLPHLRNRNKSKWEVGGAENIEKVDAGGDDMSHCQVGSSLDTVGWVRWED